MRNNNTKQLQIYSTINSTNEAERPEEQTVEDWLYLSRYLREGFGESAYIRWLQHIKYLGVKNTSDAMLLCVPSEFVKTVVLQSYFKDIASFVHKNCKSIKKIEIIVRSERHVVDNSQSNELEKVDVAKKTPYK